MLAELHGLQGKSVRWRFSAGCTKVALFPPRTLRLNALTVVLATGIAGSLAFAAYVLLAYPTGQHPVHSPIWDGRRPVLLIVFALLLSWYLIMLLKTPAMLAANRAARSVGRSWHAFQDARLGKG